MYELPGALLPASGINRNIVECKLMQAQMYILVHLRINRNIVECK